MYGRITHFLFCLRPQKARRDAGDAGRRPDRTKPVVFCSHEADLLHILVGKSKERLTGTESVVEMLMGGGGGSRKKRTRGNESATQ